MVVASGSAVLRCDTKSAIATMPRELVTVQVGQCGNQVRPSCTPLPLLPGCSKLLYHILLSPQIGWRFWDLALREQLKVHNNNHTTCSFNQPSSSSPAHRSTVCHPSSLPFSLLPAPQSCKDMLFDESMSSFFRNVDTRYTPPRDIPLAGGANRIGSLRARAVLVDTEEGVVRQVMDSALGELFEHRQLITDVSGAGNNWYYPLPSPLVCTHPPAKPQQTVCCCPLRAGPMDTRCMAPSTMTTSWSSCATSWSTATRHSRSLSCSHWVVARAPAWAPTFLPCWRRSFQTCTGLQQVPRSARCGLQSQALITLRSLRCHSCVPLAG